MFVPVRRHINLIRHLIAQPLQQLGAQLLLLPFLEIGRDFVQLHAELEAELVELFVGVRLAEGGEETVFED